MDSTVCNSKTSIEDAEVVSSCLNGDTEAFGVLVRKYERDIFNLAYRMTGNYDEACEVTQEVFITAFRNLKSFRRESAFYTWLYAIALNLTRTRLKKMKLQRLREFFSIGKSSDEAETGGYIEPESGDPSPLELAERSQIKERIQRCISRLHVLFREVIIMHDIQGLPYDDIGVVIGIPGGTVKSRLFRARKGIRDCLEKSFGGEIPDEL
jgi:RNA polymerase sigma-70 factor (ECF subfamily)